MESNLVIRSDGTKGGTQLMVGENVLTGVISFELDPITADSEPMLTATIRLYIGGTDKKE